MNDKTASKPLNKPSTTSEAYQDEATDSPPNANNELTPSIIDPVKQPIQDCNHTPIEGTPLNASNSDVGVDKSALRALITNLLKPFEGSIVNPIAPIKNKSSEKVKWKTKNIIMTNRGIAHIL